MSGDRSEVVHSPAQEGSFKTDILVPLAQETLDPVLVAALQRWLLSCGGARTRKTYTLTLKELCSIVREHSNASRGALSLENLAQGALGYCAWLREASSTSVATELRISQATAAKKISTVRSFLSFCLSEGLLTRNPLAHFKRPKVKKISRAEVLTPDEVKRLFCLLEEERAEALRGHSATKRTTALFNQVVFQTLLSVGMRIGELVTLKREGIELLPGVEMARLHLHAKGAEEHNPLVPAEVAKRLLDFSHKQAPGDYVLFPQLSRVSVEQRITRELARLVEKAGIAKQVTPHVLRATVATHLHNQGVPVGHIQRLLNHKDISTTAIYIRKAEEEIESASLNLRWT